MILDWEEIEAPAAKVFNIWVDQPEMCWAQKAWNMLGKAGLTAYDTEFDRHRVVFRFLAMASIYHDFCDVMWEEESDVAFNCGDWAEDFSLDTCILWQLYARRPDWSEEDTDVDENGDDMGERGAVFRLLLEERPAVVKALMKGFGGASGLYESLATSQQATGESSNPDESNSSPATAEQEDESDDSDDPPAQPDIWDIGGNNEQAFYWVRSGCELYRN